MKLTHYPQAGTGVRPNRGIDGLNKFALKDYLEVTCQREPSGIKRKVAETERKVIPVRGLRSKLTTYVRLRYSWKHLR